MLPEKSRLESMWKAGAKKNGCNSQTGACVPLQAGEKCVKNRIAAAMAER